jgi:nitroreductase
MGTDLQRLTYDRKGLTLTEIPGRTAPAAEGSGPRTAWDAIVSRRDVREFDRRPIADGDLDQILEAGRRSPSSQNRQPWDFIVVTDRQQLSKLAGAWNDGGAVAQSAATIALIAPAADERRRAQFDLGQATMSMMLAAAGLGIASGHSAVGDQELARRVLGFPEDKTCAFLITLGYPADRPLAPIREPDRRPLDEVVHRGHW